MLWLRAAAEIETEREWERETPRETLRLCVALVLYCEACGTTSFDLQWILKQFVGLFPIVISVSYVYSSAPKRDPGCQAKTRQAKTSDSIWFDQLIFKYNDDACSACKFGTVSYGLRSSSFDGALPVSFLASFLLSSDCVALWQNDVYLFTSS